MSTIYHLNSGTFSPPLTALQGVTCVLLVETNQGWVLIDSGFGLKDFTHPDFVTRGFLKIMRIPRDPHQTSYYQIQTLGLNPNDVRHIIFTHLHLDHAGGLSDFPWAVAHVFHKEWTAAQKRQGLLGLGYQSHQWKNHQFWQRYTKSDNDWFGFPSIALPDFDPAIYLIPLPGHTAGHCMVAIQTETGWLLQSGSAVFPFHFDKYNVSSNLPNWLERLFWGQNRSRIKQLLCDHGNQIDVVTGHDYNLWKNHQ